MRRFGQMVAALIMACVVLGSQSYAEQQVVYLDKSRDFNLFGNDLAAARPLAREIIRQAFLLAARDELGLTTRDAWLADTMPTKGDNAPWNVSADRDPIWINLVRGFRGKRAEVASHEIPESICENCNLNYHALVELEEKISRTEFVQALKRAGYSGKPNARDEKIAVPEHVESLLAEMNFVSQFAAIEELHRVARDKGESMAVLGALSRGYANLGVMTEYYWHPAHKVFKARSLLYAQRMVARDVRSPLARWHTAYAAALVGLPLWAEEELTKANEAWQAFAEANRPTQPAWVPLIEPLCRHQIAAFEEPLSDPDIGALAAMLKYLTVEQAGGKIWAVQVALETLEMIPGCYRVHEGLCAFAGVSVLHSATIRPIQIAGKAIYEQLEPIEGLPDKARDVVNARAAIALPMPFGDQGASLTAEFTSRRDLTRALMRSAATDRVEPSWATLGLLIRELSFMQAVQRAEFERNSLGVDPAEWLAVSAPLIEDHPFAAFLGTFAWKADAINEAKSRLAKADPCGIDVSARSLFMSLVGEDAARERFATEIVLNQDRTTRDFVMMVRTYQADPKQGVQYANILLEVNPRSPFAQAILVQHDWERVKADAAEWDKTSSAYPHLALTLGDRYMALGRHDDAERCYKAAIEVVPGEALYYRSLAWVYETQKKTDQWLATLESYLEQPDYGLAHFSIKEQIANHFIAEKQWEKALPYAKGAAECYSGWGLLAAAVCYEGLQQFDEAEKYYRACAERYRSNELCWYHFCRRTGQGDRKAAEALAQDRIDGLASDPNQPNLYELTTFYFLQEKPKEAMVSLERALAKDSNPSDTLWLALIAEHFGDTKARDLAIERAKGFAAKSKDGKSFTPGWGSELTDLIAKDLSDGGKGQIDLAAADKICAPLDGFHQAWFNYLLGQYLYEHGQTDAAHLCWKRTMGWTKMGNIPRTLAGVGLLKDDIGPAEYKSFLELKPAEPDAPKAGKE